MSYTSIEKLENDSLINNILNQINGDTNENKVKKPQVNNNEKNNITNIIDEKLETKNPEDKSKDKELTTPNILQLVFNVIRDPIIVGVIVTIIASPIIQEKLTTLIPLFSPQASIKNTLIRFSLGFSLFIGIKQLF